jgi:5-methylcytosine-specific restriction protein A
VIAEFLADPVLMRQIAQATREGAQRGDFTPLTAPVEDEDEGAPEGRLLIRRHVAYERNRSLRRGKLQAVLHAGRPLACEACSFDFEQRPGQGLHRVPSHLAATRQVVLGHQVARPCLLCANCHRMTHARASWLTPIELHNLIHDSG